MPRGRWEVWADRFGLRATRFWWLTAACALLAVLLLAAAWRSPGPLVTIAFEQGYGIQPGDSIRLRGIDVGVIERVVLGDDLKQVMVTARLMHEASSLARAGTQFWIERPQLSLNNPRGLDTVVGPKYIGVRPGPESAEHQVHFVGIESPRQLVDEARKSLTLKFRQGYGIRVGSPVRFRGVQVGEVVDVGLSTDGTEVWMSVELVSGAAGLAREGSQFWIERPQIDVSAVRGLDTVLTGPYLAVSPGPAGGLPVNQLTGLDAPPAAAEAIGGLEVVIESDQRAGIQAGSPVAYRGVPIGRVVQVGLASDAAGVEIRVYIEPEYRAVVRDNSKFWAVSGVDVRLGLTGVTFDSDSLATITAGGLAVATPEEVGSTVAAGHRFQLEPQPSDDWLQWRPHLPVGARLLPDLDPLAAGLRGTFSWPKRSWGVTRSQQQISWMHPVGPHRLAGALVLDDPDTIPAGLRLEYEGRALEVGAQQLHQRGSLAIVDGVELPGGTPIWDAGKLRRPARPEDCVLVAGTDSLAVSAARLQPGDVWLIDGSLPLTADWHGASAVARSDGALIGLVVWRQGTPVIVPWTFPPDGADGGP